MVISKKYFTLHVDWMRSRALVPHQMLFMHISVSTHSRRRMTISGLLRLMEKSPVLISVQTFIHTSLKSVKYVVAKERLIICSVVVIRSQTTLVKHSTIDIADLLCDSTGYANKHLRGHSYFLKQNINVMLQLIKVTISPRFCSLFLTSIWRIARRMPLTMLHFAD